jgi:predicted acylesterase/phospholipase RssA
MQKLSNQVAVEILTFMLISFVCAVTKYTHHTVNFRTYDPHDLTKSYHIPCSVVDAARATSAAPFYFPIKKIGKTTFWDGGLQNNNPICQVLGENGSEIPTVVVSLGTGIPRKVSARKVSVKISAKESQDTPNPPDFAELEGLENRKFSWPIVSQVQAVLEFVTNAENEHHSFERVLNSFQVPYYRLNPILTETVTLSDFGKMGDLVRDTKQYLEKEHARNMLVEIAELLLRPPPVDVLQEDDIIHPPSRRSSSS